MKQQVLKTFQSIMADRPYFSLMVAVAVTSLLYALFVILSVESRDIQVVTHYSGFGESHFYRTSWFYLYSFAAFGLVVGVVHAVVMAKLFKYERRILGLLFGWQSLLLIFIALVYTYKILQVAYL